MVDLLPCRLCESPGERAYEGYAYCSNFECELWGPTFTVDAWQAISTRAPSPREVELEERELSISLAFRVGVIEALCERERELAEALRKTRDEFLPEVSTSRFYAWNENPSEGMKKRLNEIDDLLSRIDALLPPEPSDGGEG